MAAIIGRPNRDHKKRTTNFIEIGASIGLAVGIIPTFILHNLHRKKFHIEALVAFAATTISGAVIGAIVEKRQIDQLYLQMYKPVTDDEWEQF
jgi:hypothetical protein